MATAPAQQAPLPSLYDILAPFLPADHAHQSTAARELEQRVKAGFAPRDVLDLGCGVGDSVDFFRRILPDARWVGVDIEQSPEVQQRRRDDAEFVTFDGVELPFPAASVDLVYTHQVFEHVRHPEPLLAHTHRVLRPGGLLVGQTSQLEPYHSFSLWNYTVYGFKELLETAGFRVVAFRPGIDGPTLIERAIKGRPSEYRRWFKEESPLNREIEERVVAQGRSTKVRNFRKLLYCGHFVFVARRAS